MNKKKEIDKMFNELTVAFLTAAIEGHEDDEINYVAEMMVERGFGDTDEARKDMAERIFKDMLNVVSESADRTITITADDVKAIARRYAVRI